MLPSERVDEFECTDLNLLKRPSVGGGGEVCWPGSEDVDGTGDVPGGVLNSILPALGSGDLLASFSLALLFLLACLVDLEALEGLVTFSLLP